MLNVKAVVAAFNQEKALVGAFSVITNLRMELVQALMRTSSSFIFAGIPRQFPCRVADYRAGLEFYALKWGNEKGRAETADCVTAG